jgi:hypothetical protein
LPAAGRYGFVFTSRGSLYVEILLGSVLYLPVW